jgi:hypothetical protein
MLRCSQTLELLRSNQDFYGMCVRVWHSRTFLKDLLALRQSGALHDRSKRLDWIKCVYQTSLADQFEDLSEPVLQKALWHVAVAHTRLPQRRLNPDYKMCIDFLKQQLVAGGYFSMPTPLFVAAKGGVVGAAVPDAVYEFLAAVARRTEDIDVGALSGHTF